MTQPTASSLDNGNKVRLQFGQRAEEYRKSRTHSDPASLDHIIEFLSPSREDEALDVGCGGGHMAAAVAKRVRELIAVDITPEMLVQTSKLAEVRGLQNLRFCLADARNLPFQSGAFDIVSCRTVLHHVYGADRSVAEMGCVLKKGGRLFIQDILGLNDGRARRFWDEIEKLRDPSHIQDYNIKEWKSFLVEGELQIIHSEVIPGVYELKEWTARSGTPVDHVEEIKMRLRNMPQAVKRHLKVLCSGDDWSIQMRYILILATKA